LLVSSYFLFLFLYHVFLIIKFITYIRCSFFRRGLSFILLQSCWNRWRFLLGLRRASFNFLFLFRFQMCALPFDRLLFFNFSHKWWLTLFIFQKWCIPTWLLHFFATHSHRRQLLILHIATKSWLRWLIHAIEKLLKLKWVVTFLIRTIINTWLRHESNSCIRGWWYYLKGASTFANWFLFLIVIVI